MNETEKVPADIGALIVSPKAYATQKQLMAGFRWLRRNNRLGRVETEGFDPFWAVTTHADIVEVSRRHDLFNNGERATTLVPRAADELARSVTGGSPHLIRTLLQMDAPDHARYRHITQAWFSRQNVGCLEARIRPIARRAIDRMAARGSCCDFARDVALHYPLHVIMEMLGLPENDEPVLLELIQQLFQDEAPGGDSKASRDPARHARRLREALTGFDAYFAPLLEQRRRRPRNDLVTLIGNAAIDGKSISPFEAVSYCMLMITAGHHTAAAAISGAIWAMCETPGEFLKVKSDIGLVPQLVEEAVRWTTPAHHMMRAATENTVMHGRRIAKGDWLMLCYLSGNRDEEAFEQPDRFHVDRDLPRNVAFGYGAHACLGQHLARLEMRVFFEELLARLAGIEMAGVPRRLASVFLGGPKTLPVRAAML
ncbi:MAG TPA: cytochrome P450 [Bradyrhizobium sp.]|jgi:cytochrome P450